MVVDLTMADHPDRVILQVLTPNGLAMLQVPLSDIKTVFQRALNTWADAPEELFAFSDQLEKL